MKTKIQDVETYWDKITKLLHVPLISFIGMTVWQIKIQNETSLLRITTLEHTVQQHEVRIRNIEDYQLVEQTQDANKDPKPKKLHERNISIMSNKSPSDRRKLRQEDQDEN